MPKQFAVSVRAQASTEIRTETVFGRDFTVIPVVAIVEGVLQGMNSPTPELALAEEFGRVPEGWNGRPVVMNHPQIDGNPVSANIPNVLETYAFGQLFNTRLEDGKLKTEAWIDSERLAALGGEVQTTIDRVLAGEIVEVSTGLFTGVEPVTGKFNGKAYTGVWRGVVPDHLAFLSAGTLGACSVADGCGTRVNASKPKGWMEFSIMSETKTEVKTSGGECDCGCGGTCKDGAPKTLSTPEDRINRMLMNSFPKDMFNKDVRTILNKALSAKIAKFDYYLLGYTQDFVIYERWDSETQSYVNKRRSYTINTDKSVVLGDTEENVLILTDIVVDNGTTPKTPLMQSEGTTMADNPKNPGEAPKTQTASTAPAEPVETPLVLEAPIETPKTPKAETPKGPRTMEQFLGEMPEEMREMMQSGLKLHNERKSSLIKALKDSGRCKFDDKQLGAMDLAMLENLAELAAVPSFEGAAPPKIVDNSSDTEGYAPEPPVLFAKKTA